MIFSLSQDSINYEEALSTFIYGENGKKKQNKSVINESEHDKTIRL
jgi:hypothetical protein